MGELLTPTHLIVVAVVAFVLFGGRRLPELGKGLGNLCTSVESAASLN
jgi:sec-independent protein translocase protein TatA